jgi:hypothetical protein
VEVRKRGTTSRPLDSDDLDAGSHEVLGEIRAILATDASN